MNQWLLRVVKWSSALLLISALAFALALVVLSALAIGLDWDFKFSSLPSLVTRYSELITGLITGILALGGGAIVLIAGREQIAAQEKAQQNQLEAERNAKVEEIIFNRKCLATVLAAETKILGGNLQRLKQVLITVQNASSDEHKLERSKQTLNISMDNYLPETRYNITNNLSLLPQSAVYDIMNYHYKLTEFKSISLKYSSSIEAINSNLDNIIKITFYTYILLDSIAKNIPLKKQKYDDLPNKDNFWGIGPPDDQNC